MRGSWGAAHREREGEIRRRLRRLGLGFALATVLVVLTAEVASADDRPLPWAGGPGVESAFEHFAAQLASVVAGRPVKVVCNASTDWNQLAAQQRFDPVTVWGFVNFTYDPATETFHPVDYMQLSEAVCWYLDQYWAAPLADKGQTCRSATRIEFQVREKKVQVSRRVKVNGRWVRKLVTVTKTVQVPVQIPQYGVCPDYQNRVFALQAISHESQHLAGVQDEATAECNGMQKLGWFAQGFGATADQGRQMAYDYYTSFYIVKRPGTPYYLPGCPNPAG
jgi:hypothetical protein